MWPEKKKIEDEFQEGREGKNPGSGTQEKSDGGKGRGLAGRRFRIASTALLIAFSSYFLLDTFVLARSYAASSQSSLSSSEFASLKSSGSSGSSSSSSGNSKSSSSQTTGTLTEGSSGSGVYADATVVGTYSDDNVTITVYRFYENSTYIYVADVQVSSAEYIKSAFAQGTYGKNVTAKTSSIADSVGAILAINGDYYGAQESGYVVRNGTVYRSTADSDDQVLAIGTDGSMKVVNASDATAQELVDQGAWQVYSFGPGLIQDGKVTVTANSEVGKAMASNPRTAIGQVGQGHYVFVVSDGRSSESQGLSLYQLAQFMKSLGATTAYNLDGGGSSTMVFQGKVINNPTTTGHGTSERSVSDIVYIGS